MKNEKLMKLNIQLFAEEADNDADLTSANTGDAASENENTEIDKTKAFSDRLNKKTREIEEQYKKDYETKINNLAKAQGFDSWEELEEASQKQAMEDLGVQDEDKFQRLVDMAINKNPEVLRAKEIIKKTEEEEKRRAVEAQIAMINKLDSKINSLEDIGREDNIQDILDKVNKGYSLYDAYLLSNLDKISSDKINGAKQKAIADVNSKGHMKTSTGAAGKTTHIPADTYAMYKRNMPSWTDEQIRKHYEKSLED